MEGDAPELRNQAGLATAPSAARAKPRLLRRLKLPELVLLSSLAFTAAVTWGLLWSSARADHARFGQAVIEAHQAIRERIATHVAVLQATAGLLESQKVDQTGFLRFASRLRLSEDYPGIQGVGWSVRLAPGAVGAAGRGIWPSRAPEPHMVAFLYPLDRRNRAALGFNMFSEPTRRAAMIQARDTGLPAVTRPVRLVQEIDQAKQTGFLIYVPVYFGEGAPQTLEGRRERFAGFAYGAFRAGDFFASIFGREVNNHQLRISVYDGPHRPENLIYRSWAGVTRQPEFRRTEVLPVPGRNWRIQYDSSPEFEAASHRDLAWLIMVLGVFTSLVLYVSTRELMRGRLTAEAAARTAEHEIQVRRRAEEHQQLLINELNHRVKNTLATVQSIGAQTLRTAPDMARARESFEARLLALSAAHDLLTSRRWEGADITDVVRNAAAPFDTGAAAGIRAEGPSVSLPPAQALALAMALHELGTNAVKYGALSRPGGRIAVAWSLAPDGALQLDWRESGGPPVAPPTRGGFGTRLIERSLARDLGGTVQLEFPPQGAHCRIVFHPAGQPPQGA